MLVSLRIKNSPNFASLLIFCQDKLQLRKYFTNYSIHLKKNRICINGNSLSDQTNSTVN